MVLYFNCLSKDLDPKIANILRVIILVTILSLPFLISVLPDKNNNIYTLIITSVIFLAVLQILALFCKKYNN